MVYVNVPHFNYVDMFVVISAQGRYDDSDLHNEAFHVLISATYLC